MEPWETTRQSLFFFFHHSVQSFAIVNVHKMAPAVEGWQHPSLAFWFGLGCQKQPNGRLGQLRHSFTLASRLTFQVGEDLIVYGQRNLHGESYFRENGELT